jgi:rhodanese-related sulfurtransferase
MSGKQTGVIPNSILLTFFKKNGTYNLETWHKKLGYVIDTNKPYVLICRSGRRTKIISQMINNKSDKTIYNVKYGINSWLQSNLHTVKP